MPSLGNAASEAESYGRLAEKSIWGVLVVVQAESIQCRLLGRITTKL